MSRRRFDIGALLAVSTLWALPAAADPTTVEGKWSLVSSRGVTLPIGTCARDGADEFKIDDSWLSWSPRARLEIPSLQLSIVSRSTNISSIPMLLSVSDKSGERGEVWISGSTLFLRFKDGGVELQFKHCS